MMIDETNPLLVASASPRRRLLLETVGVAVEVAPVDIDESVEPHEDGGAYLGRIVHAKHAAAAAKLSDRPHCPALLVADTVVIQDGQILGKPASNEEAVDMLSMLAGGRHQVATRFLIAGAEKIIHVETMVSSVWFRPLGRSQIKCYVACGEGTDKAGPYAIQGVAAMFVSRIEGDYANIVGLPICRVIQVLQKAHLLGDCPGN